MGKSQIQHVYIVADAGPIGRGVAVTVDLKDALPVGHSLKDPRHDVCLWDVGLAHGAIRPRSRHIEVAKANSA